MKTTRFSLLGGVLCLALGLLTPTSAVPDDNRDRPREDRAAGSETHRDGAELRKRFEQLERQVRAAREAENQEAVEKGMRELRELRERVQRDGDGKRDVRGDKRKRDGGKAFGNVPAPETRERLMQLKRKHDELRAAGKNEEAEKVAREAREIMQRFGGHGGDMPAEVRERLEGLREQIAKLREAGESEKAAELEQEARAILAREGASPGQSHQRIEHLQVAVKHLREAGMNELAERAMAELRKLQQELGREVRTRDDSPRREATPRNREPDADRVRD